MLHYGGIRSTAVKWLGLAALALIGACLTPSAGGDEAPPPHAQFRYDNSSFDAVEVRLFCNGAVVIAERGIRIGEFDGKSIKHPCSGMSMLRVRYLGGKYWRSEPFHIPANSIVTMVIAARPNFNYYTVYIGSG